ncbi:hypothetical protein G7Y89_g13008 [Cudoniella acicularis]|uniref:Uncharacterized protein n=1 Tax=Cudoniella acicularis TaxID=354080 RepID=A0A8H4RAQ7_9HELO|nr:hypothetical protein G7Y89_g13008 [Cudoniella acicularis]
MNLDTGCAAAFDFKFAGSLSLAIFQGLRSDCHSRHEARLFFEDRVDIASEILKQIEKDDTVPILTFQLIFAANINKEQSHPSPWSSPPMEISHATRPSARFKSPPTHTNAVVKEQLVQSAGSVPPAQSVEPKVALLELGILLLEVWHEITLETRFGLEEAPGGYYPRLVMAREWLNDTDNPLPDYWEDIKLWGHTKHGLSTFTSDSNTVPFTPFGPTRSHFSSFHSSPTVPVSNVTNHSLPTDLAASLPKCPPTGTLFCTTDLAPHSKTPMHRTLSVDYAVVVEGECTIVLDGGEEKTAQKGEFFVGRGGNHILENKGDVWCRVAVVMVGAKEIVLGDGSKLEETQFKR